MSELPSVRRDEGSRVLHAAAAVVIAVAVVGFVSGTHSTPIPSPVAPAPGPAPGDRVVPRYDQLSGEARGPNADLYADLQTRLTAGLPGLTDEVGERGDPAEVRAARAARRAYDGAPPTIPHPIDQRGYPACMTCHDRGAMIGDRVAPAMSHERHDSCTQCHAPELNPVDLGTAAPANGFVGLSSPGAGSRAWDGAPPTIPHTTAMRDRCDSCHGVAGANPIRTTHPWRQSCRQCHVPDAAGDRRDPFPVHRGSP